MDNKFDLKFIGNDIDLHTNIVNTGIFNDVTIDNNFNFDVGNVDILLVSDRVVNYNTLIEYYSKNNSKFKKVFYMLSGSAEASASTINVLKTKGIITIPPHLTANQIVERICREIGNELPENKNTFVFFGADSKVGTSITVQAIAEDISNHTRCKVLLLNLSGQPSVNYFSADDVLNLDTIKSKIFTKVLQAKELVDSCYQFENLYVLPTTRSICEMRYYHPQHVDYLVRLAADDFDVVLIDAGCNVNLGLCIGALNASSNRFLITTQQDNSRRNYEAVREQVFSCNDIFPKEFLLIINKYIDSPGLYTPSQIADLYESPLAGTITYLEYGWQAESDKCSLLKYDNPLYNKQIEDISMLITKPLNIEYFHLKKKKTGLLDKIFTRS